MNISKLASAEALEAVSAMETVEELREAATSVGVTFSGNTGISTLKKKIEDALSEKLDEAEPEKLNEPGKIDLDFGGEKFDESFVENTRKAPSKEPTIPELLEMDANEIFDNPKLVRAVVRAKALRLHRVKISNLDPNDSQLSGGIVTVANTYTGKVSKYIPYGDEDAPNGYHIPEILLNHLKSAKFPLRKEIKGGQFGVKKYKTSMVPKFAIEELPMLTDAELKDLASVQRASHSIDN